MIWFDQKKTKINLYDVKGELYILQGMEWWTE